MNPSLRATIAALIVGAVGLISGLYDGGFLLATGVLSFALSMISVGIYIDRRLVAREARHPAPWWLA